MSGEKYLYRIMNFSHAVQLFEKKELYFAKPSSWDDPYEQRLKHSQDHAVFAQCWGRNPISDAMWRIYSQHGLGVRISTTENSLREALRAACKENGYKYRLREVDYRSQKEINETTRKIAEDLKLSFDLSRAIDILYVKREAFSHETEWRVVLFAPNEERDTKNNGISIKIEPHKLIKRILLDPRAPEEVIKAFTFYFKEKLGFQGSVSRSALYKSPEQHVIESRNIDAKDL